MLQQQAKCQIVKTLLPCWNKVIKHCVFVFFSYSDDMAYTVDWRCLLYGKNHMTFSHSCLRMKMKVLRSCNSDTGSKSEVVKESAVPVILLCSQEMLNIFKFHCEMYYFLNMSIF